MKKNKMRKLLMSLTLLAPITIASCSPVLATGLPKNQDDRKNNISENELIRKGIIRRTRKAGKRLYTIFDENNFLNIDQFKQIELFRNKFIEEKKAFFPKLTSQEFNNDRSLINTLPLTDNINELLKIYKGVNGNVYLNKDEALNSMIEPHRVFNFNNIFFWTPEVVKNYIKIGAVNGSNYSFDLSKYIKKVKYLKYQVDGGNGGKRITNPIVTTDSDFQNAQFNENVINDFVNIHSKKFIYNQATNETIYLDDIDKNKINLNAVKYFVLPHENGNKYFIDIKKDVNGELIGDHNLISTSEPSDIVKASSWAKNNSYNFKRADFVDSLYDKAFDFVVSTSYNSYLEQNRSDTNFEYNNKFNNYANIFLNTWNLNTTFLNAYTNYNVNSSLQDFQTKDEWKIPLKSIPSKDKIKELLDTKINVENWMAKKYNSPREKIGNVIGNIQKSFLEAKHSDLFSTIVNTRSYIIDQMIYNQMNSSQISLMNKLFDYLTKDITISIHKKFDSFFTDKTKKCDFSKMFNFDNRRTYIDDPKAYYQAMKNGRMYGLSDTNKNHAPELTEMYLLLNYAFFNSYSESKLVAKIIAQNSDNINTSYNVTHENVASSYNLTTTEISHPDNLYLVDDFIKKSLEAYKNVPKNISEVKNNEHWKLWAELYSKIIDGSAGSTLSQSENSLMLQEITNNINTLMNKNYKFANIRIKKTVEKIKNFYTTNSQENLEEAVNILRKDINDLKDIKINEDKSNNVLDSWFKKLQDGTLGMLKWFKDFGSAVNSFVDSIQKGAIVFKSIPALGLALEAFDIFENLVGKTVDDNYEYLHEYGKNKYYWNGGSHTGHSFLGIPWNTDEQKMTDNLIMNPIKLYSNVPEKVLFYKNKMFQSEDALKTEVANDVKFGKINYSDIFKSNWISYKSISVFDANDQKRTIVIKDNEPIDKTTKTYTKSGNSNAYLEDVTLYQWLEAKSTLQDISMVGIGASATEAIVKRVIANLEETWYAILPTFNEEKQCYERNAFSLPLTKTNPLFFNGNFITNSYQANASQNVYEILPEKYIDSSYKDMPIKGVVNYFKDIIKNKVHIDSKVVSKFDYLKSISANNALKYSEIESNLIYTQIPENIDLKNESALEKYQIKYYCVTTPTGQKINFLNRGIANDWVDTNVLKLKVTHDYPDGDDYIYKNKRYSSFAQVQAEIKQEGQNV